MGLNTCKNIGMGCPHSLIQAIKKGALIIYFIKYAHMYGGLALGNESYFQTNQTKVSADCSVGYTPWILVFQPEKSVKLIPF